MRPHTNNFVSMTSTRTNSLGGTCYHGNETAAHACCFDGFVLSTLYQAQDGLQWCLVTSISTPERFVRFVCT